MKLTLIKTISKSLGTRYVKYGGFAAIITVAVIAAVIFLNLIFQQFSPQIDMTETKRYSLSDQTIQVLGAIKNPVTFYGIWEPGREDPEVREVAELYAAKSRMIRFEEIDPDLNPGLLQRFDRNNQGISKGSLIVEGEKGFKVISPEDMYEYYYNERQQPQFTGVAVERRITGALIYVSTGETPAVYEITGHGEFLLSQLMMNDQVEQENYTLRELNLIQSPVPEDATALILNNPQTALAATEAERIREYLEKGGRLLVMMNYRGGDALDSVNEILASYGIRYDFGIAFEPDRNFTVGRNLFEFVPATAAHDIINPLVEKKSPPVMSYAMGISVLDLRRRTVNVVPFLNSSGTSYLRTDLDNRAQERVVGDRSGPFNLGVAVLDPEYVQNNDPQTRIVALGSPVLEPVITYMQQLPGNLDLFMNSLTWIEDRPETLSVRSRSLFMMPLRLSFLQILVCGLAFVAVIPLALFILALVTWLKRRHL